MYKVDLFIYFIFNIYIKILIIISLDNVLMQVQLSLKPNKTIYFSLKLGFF